MGGTDGKVNCYATTMAHVLGQMMLAEPSISPGTLVDGMFAALSVACRLGAAAARAPQMGSSAVRIELEGMTYQEKEAISRTFAVLYQEMTRVFSVALAREMQRVEGPRPPA